MPTAGRMTREVRHDRSPESHVPLRREMRRLRTSLGLPRSLTQNSLVACALALVIWSVIYFEAGLGAFDLLGLYQTDVAMAVIRLAAMVAAAGFIIRAAIDVEQLPQVVRGWAWVPLAFALIDVAFMTIPNGSLGTTEPQGALVLALVNFALGIVTYVLCARATSEHPEATELYRRDRARMERRMADHARHPLQRFRR